MRITLSGSTGFIGRFLLTELARQASPPEVLCLTRDEASARRKLEPFPFARPIRWSPEGSAGAAELAGVLSDSQAVVHLAGEPVVGTRLSERKKQRVLESRVGTTELIVAALELAAPRPRVLLSASAVGFYGDQPWETVLDEDSPKGSDFLADVCQRWEEAAVAAERLGLRVVRCRIGIVLGQGGGALEKMALPIKWFVGGKIGSGRQAVPWISAPDVARALVFCLSTEAIEGAVNLTAPHPVTNEQLVQAIGAELHRPTFLPVPKAALGLMFGEGAEVLTSGQRVIPRKLLSAGFAFQHPTLTEALSAALR